MFWWLMKHVLLGPFLRLFFHPEAEGLENIPEEGGAILAGNHQSFLDNMLMPLVIPDRKVVFLGKAEYFEKWYMRWFFKGAAMIPIKRGGGSASEAALDTAVEGLRDGQAHRHLPRGHALAGRPAVSGEERRRAHGPGGRRAGHPRGHHRDVRGDAVPPEDPTAAPGDRPLRRRR